MSEQPYNYFQSAAENEKWLKQSLDSALPTKKVERIQEKFIQKELETKDQFDAEDILPNYIYANLGDKEVCINALAKTVDGIFCLITNTNDNNDVTYLELVGSAILTSSVNKLTFRQKENVIISAYELDDNTPEVVDSDDGVTYGVRHLTLIEGGHLIGRYLYPENTVKQSGFPLNQVDTKRPVNFQRDSKAIKRLFYENGAHLLDDKLEELELCTPENY